MAEIKFTCPHCSKSIRTDVSFAGRTGTCPYCDQPITVPGSAPEGLPVPIRRTLSLSTPLSRCADGVVRLLCFMRGRESAFWRYQRTLSIIGAYAVAVAGALVALEFLALSMRARQLSIFGLSLLVLVAAFFLHFLATKFALAGGASVQHSPAPAPQSEFVDAAALITALGAVVSLVAGLAITIVARTPFALGPAAALFVGLAHVAVFAANPSECLNLRNAAGKSGDGEQFLSLVIFRMRLLLMLVPLAMAALAVVGVLLAAISAFTAMFALSPGEIEDPLIRAAAVSEALIAGAAAVAAALLPMLAYVIYLLIMLVVNLCHSVLGRGARHGMEKAE